MSAAYPVQSGGPMMVGPYRLLRVIGEGGMGVVHLAEGPDGRQVAVKVLRPHIVGDQEARQRLAQEVSSLERVRSPRIAAVVDSDPWGDVPYVATRYVHGPTLHELVRSRGPIPAADLGWFAEELSEALMAVHRVGVLHRDIKPSNVLVEHRSPVLIDFGLARLADDPRLTATGWLLGTPGYLAPEILYGDEPTPASDVHAFAATMVYAATGAAPYGRGPAMAIMDRVRRGEHDLADIADPMRSLLEECLAPDPLDRPTLRELHAEFGEVTEVLPARGSLPTPAPMPRHVAPMPRPLHPLDNAATGVEPTVVVNRDLDPEGESLTTALPTETAFTQVQPLPVGRREPTNPRAAVDLPTQDFARAPIEPTYIEPAPIEPLGHRPPAGPIAPEPGRRPAKRLGLVGLGCLAIAVVAYLPYLGAATLIAFMMIARAGWKTGQRHAQRREVRGGERRWYDIPASVIASPGYLLTTLAGSALLALWSVAVALASAIVLMLLQVKLPIGITITAAAFCLALWWGPSSDSFRRSTAAMVPEFASGSRRLGFVAVCVLIAAALLLMLSASGPQWLPGNEAPWTRGFVHQLTLILPSR